MRMQFILAAGQNLIFLITLLTMDMLCKCADQLTFCSGPGLVLSWSCIVRAQSVLPKTFWAASTDRMASLQ